MKGILVKGKYNSARVYASVVELEALDQIQSLCDQEWAKDSHIAIMADTHAGAGCTIGTSMTLSEAVAPNLVGVDIGCGMRVLELGKVDLDLATLDAVIHEFIPSGKNVHELSVSSFDLSSLIAPVDVDYALRSIGTLGGGNHFIEVDKDEEGNVYLVIHSGSRHLGVEICKYHQKIADSTPMYDCTGLIEQLKAAGREKEIQKALMELKESYKPKGYLDGAYYYNYLNDMRIAQAYAVENRRIMADTIVKALDLKVLNEWETIHNYIDLDNNILRKGAVSAQLGEKLLIPMNMRDGSLVCIGKGNPKYNFTAPHGAGRIMSRRKAREQLSMDEFAKSMSNIYSSTVCEATIDEAPMAYKPWEVILDDIKDTVEVVNIIKPIYNFKAQE